eukprot:9460211-Lingulodinium_polyedra.AAC.1
MGPGGRDSARASGGPPQRSMEGACPGRGQSGPSSPSPLARHLPCPHKLGSASRSPGMGHARG